MTTETQREERAREVLAAIEIEASGQRIDVMDPDALDRYRDQPKGRDGHDMASLNLNSLRRIMALIDFMATKLATLEDGQKSASRGEVAKRVYYASYAPLRSAQHALDIISRQSTDASVITLAEDESERIDAAIKAIDPETTLTSPQPTDGWVRIEDAAAIADAVAAECEKYPGNVAREASRYWAKRIATEIRALSPAKVENQGCMVPPEGWWCSREPGHDGPCAARKEGDNATAR